MFSTKSCANWTVWKLRNFILERRADFESFFKYHKECWWKLKNNDTLQLWKLWNFIKTVCKNQKFTLMRMHRNNISSNKLFSIVITLSKPLISRNFCKKVWEWISAQSGKTKNSLPCKFFPVKSIYSNVLCYIAH